MVSGFVLMFVVYLVLLNVVCFLRLGVCLCIVSLCSGCDGCCAFCLICDACSSWYFLSGSIFVSSYSAVCLCPVGAVTAVLVNCCINCVDTSFPQLWVGVRSTVFWASQLCGQPAGWLALLLVK